MWYLWQYNLYYGFSNFFYIYGVLQYLIWFLLCSKYLCNFQRTPGTNSNVLTAPNIKIDKSIVPTTCSLTPLFKNLNINKENAFSQKTTGILKHKKLKRLQRLREPLFFFIVGFNSYCKLTTSSWTIQQLWEKDAF